jgi:alkylhydroperoxidase family enzyme
VRSQKVPRIKGVTSGEAGFGTRIIYFFTRRSMMRTTGRSPERMLEPVEMYGHSPALLRAYGWMEQATGNLKKMPARYMALAGVKTATLVACEYCIDIGSQIFRQLGLTDEELLALPAYRTSPLFDELDRSVLDYAIGMTRTPAEVSDDLFATLESHFEEDQIIELTHLIAMENMRGRFGIGLDIGSAGFSEGMVCAIPVRPD